MIDDVFTLRFQPGTSVRFEFQLKGATEIYPKEEAYAAFERATKNNKGEWYRNEEKHLASLKYALEGGEKEFKDLLDPKVADKAKKFTISALRNSCEVSHLETLFTFFKESDNDVLKLQLAEAFGWYKYSYKKNDILNFVKNNQNYKRI